MEINLKRLLADNRDCQSLKFFFGVQRFGSGVQRFSFGFGVQRFSFGSGVQRFSFGKVVLSCQS